MIKRFSLITLILMGFVLLPDQVHACTPTVTPMDGTVIPTYTLEDRVHAADIILLGTVVDGETPFGNQLRIAIVEVERYYKGGGAATVRIDGFGDSAECRAGISVGSRYIILARENADGSLFGSYFHGWSPLVNPSDENIEQIVAVTNHDLPPSGVSEDEETPEQEAVQDDTLWLIMVAVVPPIIGIIAGLILFLMRRDGRKKKAKRS